MKGTTGKYIVTGILAGVTNGLLSAASFIVFLCRGAMDWGLALPYLLGGAAGGLLSSRLFQKVPVIWLRRAFGLLILYGGIKAVFFA